MNVGSMVSMMGDEMLDAAQTLANLNSSASPGGGPGSISPSFKPPIGVPSSSRRGSRGTGARGGSRGGSGRGRGRGGRSKVPPGELPNAASTSSSGSSSSSNTTGEPTQTHEDPEEGGEDVGGGGSTGINSGVKTIAIGDKVYPESFFDEILNLRKLELLQDPEILALLKKVQRKNPAAS